MHGGNCCLVHSHDMVSFYKIEDKPNAGAIQERLHKNQPLPDTTYDLGRFNSTDYISGRTYYALCSFPELEVSGLLYRFCPLIVTYMDMYTVQPLHQPFMLIS